MAASGEEKEIAGEGGPSSAWGAGGGWLGVYFALAVAVPVAWVLITHNVWEDCLITLRHGKNLVEGKGLVFNPGHRIQGFTSCLNVMLLAGFYAITGRSTDLAIDLYRAVCLAAYVGGGWVLVRLLLRERGGDRWSVGIFILLYVTEAKTVAFTMNGQESAFMVAFASLGFAAAYRGMGKSWKMLAASFAGLLYTRPDAPVYIAAIAAVGLVFAKEERAVAWRGVIKAGMAAAVLFLPWFIGVWVYYGHPIPNTVIAKSDFQASQLLDPAGLARQLLVRFPLVSAHLFEPINSQSGGWPRPVMDTYGLACWLIGISYWMIPSKDRLGRMASFLFTLISFYFAFIMLAGAVSAWYLPTGTVFGIFVIARGCGGVVAAFGALKKRAVGIGRGVQVCIVAVSALIMIGQTIELRIQQHWVEENGRKQIGLYLHDVVKEGDRVYLEPLGYIGYYSNCYMLDWPGLVTPEIVKLHHEKGTDRYSTIPELMPEWMVLRFAEKDAAFGIAQVRDNYVVDRSFDVTEDVAAYGYFPGRGYVYSDSAFEVLRRKDVVAVKTVQ